MITVLASVTIFLTLILLLVSLLLGAKSKLLRSGPVTINVNGEKDITTGSGSTLLGTL
jgi:Na+-transporting NADH:ubiquinone oxidoreductase subunit F